MKIKPKKKIIIIVILVIVIMGALGLGGLNLMKDINEEKSVSMDKLNSIQVDMTSVGVHVIRTETSNEVTADFHGKAMQEIKLISKTDHNTLFLTVQRKHENLPLYEDVVLDVYIPEAYTKNLSIKMLSGAVKMDSFDLTNFILNTSSGKLEAEKINAEEITITSSSGSINIDECNAKKAEMETSSGNITLKNSTGNFNLISKSGTVLVDYKNFQDQNVNIKTSSGSVTLELPDTAEFLIEAKTSRGNFKSDFPIQITSKKDINGQIGTQKNKIMLQTLSGSLKILKK